MKIVLTLNELKAGNALLARLGVEGDNLKAVINMKDGDVLKQEAIVKMYSENIGDKFMSHLNKKPNVMSVLKHADNNGIECYTFIISEEFVVDVNELFGDLIVEVSSHVRVMIKALAIFLKGRVKSFEDKWKS